MRRWLELMDYVGFSEDDAALLRALLPMVEPRFEAITDRFYSTAQRYPEAAAVFQDQAQVQRLKGTLRVWLRDLLSGPHDEAYWSRRQRIGRVHVQVGLPERFVFSAMNLIREDMLSVAHGLDMPGGTWRTCMALLRILDVELAVMTASYREAHEALELRSLQDLIIGNLPVTVLVLDARGRVTSATRPSARLFGGEDHPLGSPYDHFLPQALIEAADLPTRIGGALATGQSAAVPHVVLVQEGVQRVFRITVVPLAHPLAHVLLHLEELTDAIQAEARAQHAESLARVGRLSANLAHEIRNPLAAISATLQVIGGSLAADDRRKAILGKVQEQVFRLDRLVTDLLGYSRPVAVHAVPIHLAEIAREAIAASGAAATLQVRGDATVQADPQYLQQVLVNLLQNARDAAGPEGQVQLQVGPGPQLRVVDDGAGVAPEVRERLFEPFVTTKIRGTGLGLAISRKYAEAMGGALVLEPAGAATSAQARPGAAFCLSLRPAVGRGCA